MNDKTWRSRNAPLTEEQLRAVTVGEVAPLNGTIPLEPYNLEWPAMYARLGKQIRDVLGAKVLLLEHVGSTSIPGLSAKPIIDMVLAVEDSADEISYVPPLVAAGYVLRIRGTRMVRASLAEVPRHRWESSCVFPGMRGDRPHAGVSRSVAVKRCGPETLRRTKHELAARSWKYVQNYADAKSHVVRDILTRAAAPSRF